MRYQFSHSLGCTAPLTTRSPKSHKDSSDSPGVHVRTPGQPGRYKGGGEAAPKDTRMHLP